ncbi:hypothetical protein BKG85_23095 [Mycobacteroides chelonae]|nr:hypothetical protein BKG85_23095 [Mycobacteroides chelonae]
MEVRSLLNEASADAVVVRCINALVADFERQGGLSGDDVYRLLSARSLSPDQSVLVLKGLRELQIKVDEDDNQTPAHSSPGGVGARSSADVQIRMAKHLILSADQETALGRRIKLGIDALEKTKEGTSGKGLSELVADGIRAKGVLVASNIRLVFSIARRYLGSGLEQDDLVQEGILGLLRAAEKFDYTLGYKFSTYATWWIRQSMERGIANTARTIRIPVHVVEQIDKVRRTASRIETTYGRPPSIPELAFELQMDAAQVLALRQLDAGVLSLDSLVGEDVTLGNFVVGTLESPAQAVEQSILVKTFADRLARTVGLFKTVAADERAHDIIRRRFGFPPYESPQTLEVIGEDYGVTRERIRQIEKKFLTHTVVRSMFEDLEEGWFGDESD